MNIDDYLKYYKNYSFDEILFNEMDNVLFCILCYLPIKSFSDGVSFSELYGNLSFENVKGVLPNKSIKILKSVCNSRRYKGIRCFNYVNIVDSSVQFCALTFVYRNYAFIGYKGTDNSVTGWKENFNLSCEYPTKTQRLATLYLDNSCYDKIYVGGHSKGGNLAMAASMESKNFDKIIHIYNNDGPGFLMNEFNSLKYKKMVKKLSNFLPSGSLVGILLNNCNYTFINSLSHGMNEHDLTSWECFGIFLKRGKISKSSRSIHDKLLEGVNNINSDDMRVLVDAFFNILDDNNVHELRDLKRLSFSEIYNLMGEINSVPSNTKDLFMNVIKTLLF